MPDTVVEPMQAAIQATLTAIQNRARLYRNLVVLVTAVLIGSIVVAVVFRSLIPLIGFSLLVPLAGAYFILDNRCTRLWSKQVLEMWVAGKLDLTAFSGAVSAHPYVPRGTLEGMLGLLPEPHARRTMEDRAVYISQQQAFARRYEVRTLVASAGLFSTLLFLAAAVRFRSGLPLIGAAVSAGAWMCSTRM